MLGSPHLRLFLLATAVAAGMSFEHGQPATAQDNVGLQPPTAIPPKPANQPLRVSQAQPGNEAKAANQAKNTKLASPMADAAALKLKTEKVIVFKDGYCLVVKRGVAVADASGEIYTDEVPDAAVLGSFWATPKDGRLLHFTAGWREVATVADQVMPCQRTFEVLHANQGKTCTLQTHDNVTLTGTIHQVLVQESVGLMDENAAMLDAVLRLSTSARSHVAAILPEAASANTARYINNVGGEQFVLRTEQGDVLLSVNEVRRVTIKDMATSLTKKITTKKREKRLTFRFAEPGQPRELLIAYFRPDVRWIPTYRIHLSEDKEKKLAKIGMQAELINEAEDLIDTPLDIVVGVPNFRFRDSASPLTLESVLKHTLQQSAPQLMNQFRNDLSNSAYMTQTFAVRQDAAEATGGGAVQLPNELSASGADELFVYSLPKMTLRKGERNAVPIFEAEVPYRNIYTWDMRLKRHDIAASPSGSGVQSPLVLAENKVWRQIVLTNTTNMPWTTGAAMIMQGSQPLAQEILTYTSMKDACRVPVTVAVDVRGSNEDQETDRKLNALNWNGYAYAQIFQKSTLSVCNHKAEPIEIEISLKFGGRAETATHEGKITLAPFQNDDWERYQGDTAVNNSSTVRWKVPLKPGEVFSPSVNFHFYTRH